MDHLRKHFGHVSVERILSGRDSSIFSIFMVESGVADGAQAPLGSDGAPQVSDLAFNHGHPIAMKSLTLFVEIIYAYAGNLALRDCAVTGSMWRAGSRLKSSSSCRKGASLKHSGTRDDFPR